MAKLKWPFMETKRFLRTVGPTANTSGLVWVKSLDPKRIRKCTKVSTRAVING